MNTLPDYLRPGLDIVSVGLNPSIKSVRAGFYFATPQNRFWKALNASGLAAEELTPGAAAMQRLFEVYRIGFTDVVKRPSRGMADLRARDFRKWAPVLDAKLTAAAPRIVWFHGKVAYGRFVQYARGRAGRIPWGLQPAAFAGDCSCFVTPNPSPANARFSLQDLIDWYRELAALRDRLCPSR